MQNEQTNFVVPNRAWFSLTGICNNSCKHAQSIPRMPQKNSHKASFLEKLSFDNHYFYIKQFRVGQVVQTISKILFNPRFLPEVS